MNYVTVFKPNDILEDFIKSLSLPIILALLSGVRVCVLTFSLVIKVPHFKLHLCAHLAPYIHYRDAQYGFFFSAAVFSSE